MVSVTVVSGDADGGAGVEFADQGHGCSYSAATAGAARAKSSGKWVSALMTGTGVSPPMAHSDASVISCAEVVEQREVLRRLDPGEDAVHHLHPAHGADAAGRALAAAFGGAELEGEAGLGGQVHRVVEHHDAAMAEQAARLANAS